MEKKYVAASFLPSNSKVMYLGISMISEDNTGKKFWIKTFANVDIFCHFKFCHDRRNHFLTKQSKPDGGIS